MQSIASGSFSHQGSSSNKESLGGGSQGPSNGDHPVGRPMSSLNVLAKPFISPGIDVTPSDSMSPGLKSPRQLAVTPGPCPSQVCLLSPFRMLCNALGLCSGLKLLAVGLPMVLQRNVGDESRHQVSLGEIAIAADTCGPFQVTFALVQKWECATELMHLATCTQDPVGPAGSRPMLVRGGDELTMLIQRTPTALLEPLTFFVSWQGVPTLVFR